MATYGVVTGSARLCMPVLFKEISDDLGLSIVAIGTVWGMDPLAGVFIGLPGGLLADRFGVKRTLTVCCILAGVFGALRGFSVNFLTIAATMFLFGLMAAAMPSIVPKVTAEWFSGRRLGLANGLLNVAWSIGAMTATMFSATVFSPLLGGWRSVMFLYGVPSALLGLLWLFTAREPDRSELPDTIANRVPFRQAMSHVARMKDVWVIGIIMFTNWGASMGLVGYLPIYLRNIGWTPVSADTAMTLLSGVTSIGVIPMVLLSDRLGTRKGVIFISVASLAASLALLPYVNSLGVWIILVLGGFLRSGSSPLFNVVIFEMEGVGSTYGGTATGLASTIAMLGAFVAPPLGNSLEAINPGLPFVLWAGLAALGLPLLYLVKAWHRQRVTAP
jgi:NNP family nitrate/nitrite transporter-like MFS transporter